MSANLAEAIRLSALSLQKVVKQSIPLERAMPSEITDSEMRAAVQSILYTSLRQRVKTEIIIEKLASHSPTSAVEGILSVALALLLSNEDPHTVVNEAVKAAKASPETARAAGFVNALLRNYMRNRGHITKSYSAILSVRYGVPGWWLARVRKAYPDQWREILTVQNTHAPLTLRVNQAKISVENYLEMARKEGFDARQVGPWAVVLEPACPVNKIPGFDQGLCSVQDAGCQLVSQFLGLKGGERVLDACAAPGGKSAQMLESADIDLTAMEIDPKRSTRITETLDRLGLKAKVVQGDATDFLLVRQQGPFDAIVLDAPCTASGIVRRHPDIVWLRRPADIEKLAQQQAKLLDSIWWVLPEGKSLLYIVCSIFPEEGPEQIKNFLARTPNAKLKTLPGLDSGMLRLLPTEKSEYDGGIIPSVHDGFFYALLTKEAA